MAAILNIVHLPGSGGSSYTFASIPSTTAGSLLLLFIETLLVGTPSPIGTVTDNQSQSWTVVQGTGVIFAGSRTSRLDMAYMWNSAAAVTSVTINVTGGNGGIADTGYLEVSGIQTISDPIDGHTVAVTSSGTSAAAGSFTTTATDAIFTACLDDTAHSTQPGGYAAENTGNSWFCKYDDAANLLVVAGAQNPAWTVSNGTGRIVMTAAFKLAAAKNRNLLGMMGCGT